MTSEIRANIIKNRVGLGTIEYSNTGPVISGVTTASNFKTGSSNLHSTGLNVQDLDVDGHTNLDNVSIAGVTTITSSASSALDVNGKIKVFGSDGSPYGLVISPDSSGGTYEHLIAKMNGDLRIQAGSGTYQASNANILLRNTSKNIIINAGNSGKVGIGTDNPNATGLTVYRDDTGLGNIVNIEQDGTGDAVLGFAIKGTAAWQFGIDNSDSDKFKISHDGSGLDSSTSVTLDRTGKVGINQSTPTEDLEVKGDQTATIFINAGQHDASTAQEATLKLGYNQSHANDSIGYVKLIELAGNTYDGALSFGVPYNNSGTPATREALRIKSDGKVGIGTDLTSSTYKLEVWDDSAATFMIRKGNSSRIVFSNDSQHNTIYSQALPGYTGRDFSVYIGSSEAIRINSSRKVGLGTTGSDYMLSIREADNNNKFLMLQKNSGQELLQIREDGNNHIIIDGSHASGELHFYTAGDERLRITSDGKIGIGIQNPVARLHVHNSGTTAADHAYAHFTTGDTGSTISDGLTVGVAANQVASVNFREAGTLVLNTSSTPRITILSDGKVGINHSTPDSQLVVVTDGLADNTYAFKTVYRSGSNASGYTASGLQIVSSADNSNGEKNTAYLAFSNRDPALNGAHGSAAFITMSTPDSPGTYGTGEFNFYCRNGSAYTFPNDPAVPSSYWMSSLFKIKSNGEIFGYGNLRIDTGSSADGIIGAAYGTSYFGIKQADQGASEYMMINNNSNTYISCTSGYSVYIRPSANSQTHETIFAHDNTTFKTNVVLDTHALRRNNHHWGHMEGGHNNIGSTNTKTSPIYTIGSAYNPNENDLNNMYGIGFSHSDASFINSNVTGGWGQYVASDGDARIFLNAGDGVVYANRYGRIAHNSGHLQGSYNNVGANSAQSNPIYTIGSSYNPAATTLSNMYGIGYSHGNNASFISFSGLTGWGLYVAADGDARMFLDATTGKIAATGTITGSASDVRLKTNIKVIDNPIEKIKKIRGVTFDWVDNITSEYDFHPDSMHETGVIAQEIQEVIPDAVATAPFNGNYTRKSGTDNNYLTVKNEKIIPLCIEAIKKLTAKVESLEQENTALKARVTSLEE